MALVLRAPRRVAERCLDAEAGAELKQRFTKSWGDKPTDQTISLAAVRTMFGLPPASLLELPDPEEHGRSLLHRAAHAGRSHSAGGAASGLPGQV